MRVGCALHEHWRVEDREWKVRTTVRAAADDLRDVTNGTDLKVRPYIVFVPGIGPLNGGGHVSDETRPLAGEPRMVAAATTRRHLERLGPSPFEA